MKRLLLLFVIVSLLTGCGQRGNRQAANDQLFTVDTLRYARGLTIKRFQHYTAVEINDPWKVDQLLQRYILVARDQPLPDQLPQGTVVTVPIRNVVVYTAVHAGIIDLLGESDRIIGVCEPRYMELPAIREGVKSGRIADLGESSSPNVEKMIELGAEVIIATPFQNSGYGAAEKMGIPIIEGADYMEALPLGRTEWITFYGLLFGKSDEAARFFAEREAAYLQLKELTTAVSHRPTVFSEKRFGSTWYVPAGDSYIAHLFHDAGADYLFRELPGSDSAPLSFEAVFDRAIHADLWLIKYNLEEPLSYSRLRNEYTPYEHFDAFTNRRIYGCNTGKVPYYEEFPLYPDYLLKDYVYIFHPELLPADYEPRYYRSMVE